MHYDQDYILCQLQHGFGLEGGDSVNWMGHLLYVFPGWMGWSAEKYIHTFELKPGLWCRHPSPNRSQNGWASFVNGTWDGVMSRDQMKGILCYLIKNNQTNAVHRLLLEHKKRMFLFSNNSIRNGQNPVTAKRKIPDITLGDIWALFIRGKYTKGALSWLILCICDIHLLLSAIEIRFSNDNDIISFLICASISHDIRPTFVSKIAIKASDYNDINDKAYRYWSGWRLQKEVYEYWAPKIREVFG